MPLHQQLPKGLLSGVLLLLTFFAFSQSRPVTGKITDDKGNPLPGATVTVKGTNVSVSADNSGAFRIEAPAGAHLLISSIGFTEQDISLSSRTAISIVLQSESRSLNDVVVVGYGTMRKKDVTGAVATISQKDFSPGVVNNPLQQIQGKVAGLVITQPGGDPNGNPIIRLRGQT